MAGAGNRLTFDCVLNADKAGEIGTIRALVPDDLAAAFAGHTSHRPTDADVLLVVERASQKAIMARLDLYAKDRGGRAWRSDGVLWAISSGRARSIAC